MLPDGGKICEEQSPPWQQGEKGHRILCHIPIETLSTVDPVVHRKS
jgi:peptide/nickel transport system ATP-binding protein